MTTDLIAAVDTEKRAVRAASRLCMQVADGGPALLEKGGREPVTLADYGSQAVILGMISAEFPDHAVLAEEGAAHLLDYSDDGIRSDLAALVATVTGGTCTIDDLLARIDHAGGEGPLVWAVDPIDGTKGFLRGDQFAVAVGLLEGARPVAGVLGCPRLSIGDTSGVLVWGVPGVGAFVEPIAGGDARSVRVSEVADPAGVRVLGSVETSHGDPAIIERAVAAAGLGGGWCGSTARQSTPRWRPALPRPTSDPATARTGASGPRTMQPGRQSSPEQGEGSPTSTAAISTSPPAPPSITTAACWRRTAWCTT